MRDNDGGRKTRGVRGSTLSKPQLMVLHDANPPQLRRLANYAPVCLNFEGWPRESMQELEGQFWRLMAADMPDWSPLQYDEYEQAMMRSRNRSLAEHAEAAD